MKPIQKIGLIDYGMGNLHSVQTSFKRLGQPLVQVRKPEDLEPCDALILPGVGAFDPAMEKLQSSGLVQHLRSWHDNRRPLLGICLGLQLLFERSDEGKAEGLGVFEGNVQRLPDQQGERIPHMGWGQLKPQKLCPLLQEGDTQPWVYFVHSYAAVPNKPSDLAATVSFGRGEATAMVWKHRTGACQFHPEKSAQAGAQLLKRWVGWLQSGAELPR
ncbi:imidazole glycerol phosphate synthase subunit HisH [Synechococcus sp. BIOS-U3-1]|uniref:imidazole glycerol phosphate synthase subunit HisH n=1 Tax=Synechococcus sp. BIOS-U3-1 TaxID=1400865 RepID=UPI001648E812|nr:imidazole glycerol phosphate synthase subunit HisH [Synechococcus sp. BIOS-U3-1]|tara:strand:+ start:313 stop:960 length:648 start_codon:yes stop_codon:yes gene_type:complete